MKSSKVERQRVYLAYRELFRGNNARVRSKKTILRILRASPMFQPSEDHKLKQRTISILSTLLSHRVFEIEEAAKIDFPELWAGDAQTSMLRKASMGVESAPKAPVVLDGPYKSLEAAAATSHDEGHVKRCTFFHSHAKPSKFSYDVQHQVLGTTQRILETSCFNFTREWFPSVLQDRTWSCAAALELTNWLHIMNERIDTLPDTCIDREGCAIFKKIRPCLAQLRHSAVHRLHLDYEALLGYIHAALSLTEILRDHSSKVKIQIVYTSLKDIIKSTKEHMETMQNGVNCELLALQKQKNSLDRREQQLQALVEQQSSKISDEADRFLLSCIDRLLEDIRLQSEKRVGTQCSSNDVYVDESDIESDEDQLLADL